ncbi:glutamate--cysteine ligase [bacterium]|nr:glutamate--cysteine ligase [bacterium]
MVAINRDKVKAFLASDKKTYKGLEKENLRTDLEGKISGNKFPCNLGSHHFNKYITLDYSEPHFEIVTPPFEDNLELFKFLKDLHLYLEQQIEDDFLWNYSMPPKFKKKYITLPPSGDINKSKLAYLYRLGLRNRYGDKMQSTAGIHFNISFSSSVIDSLGGDKDEIYLCACRNFLRIFPQVLRVIGASPVAHKSFIKDRDINAEFLNRTDCYLPKATSLRVSKLGYYSEEQEQKFINFNSLKDYLEIIKYYINVPNKRFKEIEIELANPKQINNGTIQMESELYNHIRPKGEFTTNERQYNQLKKGGIKYLELRSIDLNPYTAYGISQIEIEFLELLSIYCILCGNEKIDPIEEIKIKENIRRASESGQDCNLICSFEKGDAEKNIKALTQELLESLESLSNEIGLKENHKNMFKEFYRRNEVPLSTQIIDDLSNNSIVNFISSKSKKQNLNLSKEFSKKMSLEAKTSKKEYLDQQNKDKIDFETFLENYRGEIN